MVGGAPEVTTPAPGSGTLPRSSQAAPEVTHPHARRPGQGGNGGRCARSHYFRAWIGDFAALFAYALGPQAGIVYGTRSAQRLGCISAPTPSPRRRPPAQGGRHPPPGTTTWFGWCFVKCPGSYRRDGTPCPDGARCLRPVNYPPLYGRPHEHHECSRCAPPSPGQRFAD